MAHELRDLARKGIQSDVEQFRQGLIHPLQSLGTFNSLGSSGVGSGANLPMWAGILQAILLASKFLFRRRKRK
jgi:LPXTG-motif cell wall-anchored protein